MRKSSMPMIELLASGVMRKSANFLKIACAANTGTMGHATRRRHHDHHLETAMTNTDTANDGPSADPCDYSRGTWECRGGGQLWDADSDGFDPDGVSEPCPGCNTKEYLEDAKEEAETTIELSGIYGSFTGEEIWTTAVAIAKEANPAGIEAVLKAIGPIDTLVPDSSGEDGFRVVRHNKQDLAPNPATA